MILNLQELKNQFDDFYYQNKNNENKEFLANLRQAKLRLDKYINIMHLKQTSHLTFSQILKKRLRTFYRFKAKISELINTNKPLSFLLNQSKKNKTIKLKYSKQVRQAISDAFFDKYNMHNLSSFWIHQRINHHLKISLTTLSKIIKSDKRYYKQRQYFQFKHPRRYYNQKLGKLQMDIKIIPATDAKILKPIYEIDFIDE